MSKKLLQPHILCGEGDVGEYVLLPGDPARVKTAMDFLKDAKIIAENRSYITATGYYKDIKVSVTSTGIGCPSAAIAVEELAKIGAKTFIRIGTTGAIQPYIDIGDIIIAVAAVRADGTTREYVPPEYPAVASYDVISALIEAAEQLKVSPYVGIVWSDDAFYAESEEKFGLWMKKGILSVEMECSAIFTLSSLKGLRSGAILVVDGNLVKGTQKSAFPEEEKRIEDKPKVLDALKMEIKIALEAISLLEQC